MDSQLKCVIHNDEDIILINISKVCDTTYRTCCVECLRKVQLENTCQIKKVHQMMTKCSENIIGEINKEQQQFKINIKKTMKLIDTLKEEMLKIFNNLHLKLETEKSELDATLTNLLKFAPILQAFQTICSIFFIWLLTNIYKLYILVLMSQTLNLKNHFVEKIIIIIKKLQMNSTLQLNTKVH